MLTFSIKEIFVYCLVFLLIYNLSITLLIYLLAFSSNTNTLKTISSLKKICEPYKKYTFLITLLSIAGIPPFLGFFLKINLISVTSLNSILFLIIIFLFLFSVLYFYVQNVRFLIIPSYRTNNLGTLADKKAPIGSLKIITTILFITLTGGFIVDDLILIIYWLIS